MSTFTQIYYHITFSTKNRSRVLDADRREELFKYLWGVVKNHKSHLYRINGVEDHIHLLISLHPTVALADLVKNMKVASSVWIREGGIFPAFEAWQEGYGAFTCSHGEKDAVITYIKNQVEHHGEVSFQDELRVLLSAAGVVFEERYLA